MLALLGETLALLKDTVPRHDHVNMQTLRQLEDNSNRIPNVGMGGTPFLNTLVDAVERKGVYS